MLKTSSHNSVSLLAIAVTTLLTISFLTLTVKASSIQTTSKPFIASDSDRSKQRTVSLSQGKLLVEAPKSTKPKPSTDSKQTNSKSNQEQETEEWFKEFKLALDLNDDGKFEEAFPHFKKSLALMPAGEKSRDLVKQEMGVCIYQLGFYDAALDVFLETTANFQKDSKKYQDEIILGYEMISRTCRHLDKIAEAERFGLKALNLSAAVYGLGSWQYALNLRNMGKFYIGTFRYLDAEDALGKAVELLEREPKVNPLHLAGSLELYWYSLNEQGKSEKANAILAKIEVLEKKIGEKIHEGPQKATKHEMPRSYMASLQYNIKKNWSPPKTSDDCLSIVVFKIHQNGTISDLKIDMPSGDQAFDENCVQTVKDAFKSPIFLPKGLDDINISFTFERSIQNDSVVSSKQSEKRIDPVAVAQKLIATHNYREANAILNRPDLQNSIKANLGLAEIALKLNRFDEAEKFARKVIGLDPQNTDAYLLCGKVLQKQLKMEEAISCYQKIAELNAPLPDRLTAERSMRVCETDLKDGASIYRASELISQRKGKQALEVLQRLQEKYQRNKDIESCLADAYSLLGQDAKALQHIKTAKSLDPHDLDLLLQESWIEQSLGHGQNAIKCLQEIVKSSPSNNMLAYTKSLLKRLEQDHGLLTSKNDDSPDYFKEMSQNPRRWKLEDGKPINVYICSGDYVPGYRNELPQYLIDSLNKWSDCSGGKIKFKITNDLDSAQIICRFKNNKDDMENAVQAGCTYAIGGCANITSALVYITTETPGSLMSDEQIHTTCLHELGHALGLAHSKNQSDIMYFASTSKDPNISERDKNTLTRLYSENLKFPEWALMEEKGLALLAESKPREALVILEQAHKLEPTQKRIISDLSRAYGLAVCQNLMNGKMADSGELLSKAHLLPLSENDKSQIQNLSTAIDSLNKLTEDERKLALQLIIEKLKRHKAPANH